MRRGGDVARRYRTKIIGRAISKIYARAFSRFGRLNRGEVRAGRPPDQAERPPPRTFHRVTGALTDRPESAPVDRGDSSEQVQ